MVIDDLHVWPPRPASGLRGRNPDAPTVDNFKENRRLPRDPHTFGFPVWQLKDGEDRMIAKRLVEIFSEAKKA